MSTDNKNGRALAIFQRITESTGVTSMGRSALLQLINPMSDFEFQKAGYYDTEESPSVVQCVKFSQTIAAPASAAGGNWDAHIFNLPSTASFAPQVGAIGGGYHAWINGQVWAGKSVGGVTVATGLPGADLSVNGSLPVATSTLSAAGLCPTVPSTANSPSFVAGTSRIIGMGWEVHNTTAVINRQGAVAVYRQPQPNYLDRIPSNNIRILTGTLAAPLTAEFRGSHGGVNINDVPHSLSAAMLLAGSQQWDAEDGVMVVPTLHSSEIPPQKLSSIVPLIRNGVEFASAFPPGAGGVLENAVTAYQLEDWTVTNPAGMSVAMYPKQKYNQFHTTGAYFTGLSNATTLVVNSVFYIERFPTSRDGDLVTMANPSSPHDDAAMKLYTLIMHNMPVAVKVNCNADGDWFFDAVSTVAKFLGPAFGALGGPIGLLGSGAMPVISKWADDKKKERNSEQAVAKRAQAKAAQQNKKTQKAVLNARKAADAAWAGGPPKPNSAKGSTWENGSGMPKRDRAITTKKK